MSENPYQSPIDPVPTRQRIRIRFLPAAVFFIFGLILAIGNAGLLALAPFVEPPSIHKTIAGRTVFVFAGVSWMAAGRYWNRGAWTRATLWSIIGYITGVAAANLTRLGMLN